MKNLTLTKFDRDTDLEQLQAWKKLYKSMPEYKKIVQYILSGNEKDSVARLLLDLHDRYQIGDNEVNLVLLAKDENQKIVGAMVVNFYGYMQRHPACYIHYIFTNPEHTKQGVAKFMLNEFITNIEKYLSATPEEIFANIKKNNKPSLSLFKSVGFTTSAEFERRFIQMRAKFAELQADLASPKKFE